MKNATSLIVVGGGDDMVGVAMFLNKITYLVLFSLTASSLCRGQEAGGSDTECCGQVYPGRDLQVHGPHASLHLPRRTPQDTPSQEEEDRSAGGAELISSYPHPLSPHPHSAHTYCH